MTSIEPIALGRLERVEPRSIWEHEDAHFTPWLAQPENLRTLGDTIGIELELEAQERNVGPFRADILCKNTADETWVLIENQLARTDHSHLGQLLTYAAGLQAVTIVWISVKFTEEHRAALNWLNEITDDRFNFFGLEVEVWQIGSSLPAPKFNIIAKPNEWSRSVLQAANRIATDELTGTKILQLEFWTALQQNMLKRQTEPKPQKPRPSSYALFSIGRAGLHLAVAMVVTQSSLRIELVLNDDNAKPYFRQLFQNHQEIETAIGEKLVWDELLDQKKSIIWLEKKNVQFADRESWPLYQEWIIEKLTRFRTAFASKVRNLDSRILMQSLSDLPSVDTDNEQL